MPFAAGASGAARAVSQRRLQPFVSLAAATALATGTAAVAVASGGRMAVLFVIGALLGLSLYHAAYGFTHGFRAFLNERRSAHLRAQLLMLAAAILLFFPALAAGTVLGTPVRGFVFPVGLNVVIGAFLFGIGMQLGGGCASGTLYTAGGGSTRMVVTLVFFIAGASLAAFSFDQWRDLPTLPAVSLLNTFGLASGIAVNLVALGVIWLVVARTERRHHTTIEPIFSAAGASFIRGPWPYAWGALALAVLNVGTLIAAGRPWAITQAFALWGSLAVERSGFGDPFFWSYWEEPTRVEALHRSILADGMSVMNAGIVGGALLAAGIAGLFAPVGRVALPHLAASVLGGLLLGFGAILATGCNVSAYFSGIASGSLHGWVWIAAALPGNALGIRLRPLFKLDLGMSPVAGPASTRALARP